MLVRVGVVERQAGGRESRELRADLGGELSAHRGEGVAEGERELVGGEGDPLTPALSPKGEGEKGKPSPPWGRGLGEGVGALHQQGNLRRRQHGRSLDHHKVQPHAQRRQRPRAPYRIGGGGRTHHQTGSGENPLAMGPLDRLVHRL